MKTERAGISYGEYRKCVFGSIAYHPMICDSCVKADHCDTRKIIEERVKGCLGENVKEDVKK